jgi:hypothetical protein
MNAVPIMRIPAGWTYLGLYGSRSGRAKPHYRTAPGVIRMRRCALSRPGR